MCTTISCSVFVSSWSASVRFRGIKVPRIDCRNHDFIAHARFGGVHGIFLGWGSASIEI